MTPEPTGTCAVPGLQRSVAEGATLVPMPCQDSASAAVSGSPHNVLCMTASLDHITVADSSSFMPRISGMQHLCQRAITLMQAT